MQSDGNGEMGEVEQKVFGLLVKFGSNGISTRDVARKSYRVGNLIVRSKEARDILYGLESQGVAKIVDGKRSSIRAYWTGKAIQK